MIQSEQDKMVSVLIGLISEMNFLREENTKLKDENNMVKQQLFESQVMRCVTPIAPDSGD